MQLSKTRRIAATVLIFVLAFSAMAFAQEEEEPAARASVYSLGQQTFAISLGLFIPLFFMDFNGVIHKAPGEDFTNLSLGGLGSLQWGIHLDNHWLVGAEVAGLFSKSTQENILYMLSLTAKGAFIFHAFPFEFPVFLGAGMDIIKYTPDQGHINFILKPGFSSLWKYNVNWGFGLNVVYWWVVQPWPKEELGRMGNFLEVSATAQYSF